MSPQERDRARAWIWKRAAKAARADRNTLREEVVRLEEKAQKAICASASSTAMAITAEVRRRSAESALEKAIADLARAIRDLEEARGDLEATEAELLALHAQLDGAELEAESEVES